MGKTLKTLLVFMLALTVILAGCSSNDGNNGGKSAGDSNQSGNNGSAKPAHINIFMPQGANWDFETNSFTKFAEEKFNIEFTIETTTWDATAAAEKRKIALASDSYPDLFMLIPWVDQFSQTELIQYGKQGVVIPLNDLIDEYAPNVKKVIEENPYYKSMVTSPDGNIYGLPQFIECYHCSYPSKMWVNSDWLEALNLDMPATLDEFTNMLKAFKTQDPNGNNKADEIPLSGSVALADTSIIPFLMNGFIYDDSKTRLLLNNGNVDFAANKEEWKEGLAYIASLYEDGLIDPGAFTQNQEAYQQLGNNAEAPILGAAAAMHPRIFATDPEKYNSYDPVAPLQGPHQLYAAYNFPSTAGASFVLTNKASDEARIAAIKLVDYMFTEEGQLRAYFGEENVGWRKPEPGEVAANESVEPRFAQIVEPAGTQHHNTDWIAISQYYQPKEFSDAQVQATDIYSPDGYNKRLYQATDLYQGHEPDEVYPYWSIWIDPAVADEYAMLETNIQDYVEQNALQFITGNKDLNSEWDSYLKGLNSLNLERYLEIMQNAYDNAGK